MEEFIFPSKSIISPKSYFKITLPDSFLSRDHSPSLFKYNSTSTGKYVYTGDFIEFIQSEYELSVN